MTKETAIPLLVIGILMLVNQFGLQSLFQLVLPFILISVAVKAMKPVVTASTGGHGAGH